MIYRSVLRPLLFSLPPERAHDLALHALSLIAPLRRAKPVVSSFGTLHRFGLQFHNPIGLAAGFDKNGVAVEGLASLGFGFIEVGTVTSEAQRGNPKPRLFRLTQDQALINRLGFNNRGASEVANNLRQRLAQSIVGVNLGKSRSVAIDDAIPDYLASLAAVYEVADYLAINVSSPNTPHLRELQRPDLLRDLLLALQQKNWELAGDRSPKPLLLKIAPDLTETEVEAIIQVAVEANAAGIIATNTTITRAGLRTPPAEVSACGEGGLSGAPLRNRSTKMISTIYRLTSGTLPVIGCGGVFTAEDAWEKICAGAALIQLYTGFIYEGPGIARRINEGLTQILKREGFKSIDDAVGHRVAGVS